MDNSIILSILQRMGERVPPHSQLILIGGGALALLGSHRQYKHARKPGRVTIAGHPSDEMAPGTLNSVLKQAQLKQLKKSERQ